MHILKLSDGIFREYFTLFSNISLTSHLLFSVTAILFSKYFKFRQFVIFFGNFPMISWKFN
jgi:hypothetical protein